MSREPTGQLIELRATIMEISFNKMKLWIRRGNVCFALRWIKVLLLKFNLAQETVI